MFAARLALALSGMTAAAGGAGAGFRIDYVIRPDVPPVADSWFFGLNNAGTAVGYASTPAAAPQQNPVAYQNGALTPLAVGSGDFGFLGNTATVVNAVGVAAGQLDGQLSLFAGGAAAPVATPGLTGAVAVGLTEAATVLAVGTPADPTVSTRYGLSAGGVFTPLTGLDPLFPQAPPPDPADPTSGPSATTFVRGQTGLDPANRFAAGVFRTDFAPGDPADPTDDVTTTTFQSAFVADGVGGFNLLTPAASGDEIEPYQIGADGSVFGRSGTRLVVWNPDGTVREVLPDPGTALDFDGFFGYATAQRNGLGEAVAITAGGGVALYDPLTGWADITGTIAGLDGGVFRTIQGFNDARQFVGVAVAPRGDGGTYAYFVTPTADTPVVPAPAGLLVGLVAAAGLAAARRR